MNYNFPKSKILSLPGLYPLLNGWVVAICVIGLNFFSSCVTTSQDWDINSDFEEEDAGMPVGWNYNVSEDQGYTMVLDSQVRMSGNYALRIQADADSPHVWAGAATRQIPVWFKMRDVRLRGYVKWQAVSEGFAGLWCRVERWDGISRYEQQGSFQESETEDWGWYEIPVPVDDQARQIQFGGLLRGPGTVWLDSLTLEVDGVPYPLAAEKAAKTLEDILVPGLKKEVRPLPEILQNRDLQAARLVVLNLADLGSEPLLSLVQDFYDKGNFDQLLVNAGSLELEALRASEAVVADSQTLAELLPWQVKSQELWTLLNAPIPVKGVDIGSGKAAVDLLRPYMDATEADRLDSLHEALLYQIGREFISPATVQSLAELQQALFSTLPSQTYPAQRRLTDLLPYYQSNGSSYQRELKQYGHIDSLVRSSQGRSLLLTWEPLRYGNDPDLLRLIRNNMPETSYVIGATVGKGNRLNRDGERRPLAPLVPAAHEYYFQKLSQQALWMPLRQGNSLPWLPRQMFWRQSLYDSGYTTVHLQDFFDALIYVDQSRPASPI